MTKFNKVGKSTFVIAILSFLLVAVLAFGGTYAYFSAKTNTFTGNITMGALHVELKDKTGTVSALGNITLAHPNQRILSETYTVDLGETSTVAAFARVKVTAELDKEKYPTTGTGENIKYDRTDNGADKDIITPLNIFTVAAGAGWVQHTDGYTYYVNSEDPTIAQAIQEKSSVSLPLTIDVNKEVGKGGSTFFMGATGTYTITVEVIQAEYLDSNTTAENEYTVIDLAKQWNNIVNAGTYPVA